MGGATRPLHPIPPSSPTRRFREIRVRVPDKSHVETISPPKRRVPCFWKVSRLCDPSFKPKAAARQDQKKASLSGPQRNRLFSNKPSSPLTYICSSNSSLVIIMGKLTLFLCMHTISGIVLMRLPHACVYSPYQGECGNGLDRLKKRKKYEERGGYISPFKPPHLPPFLPFGHALAPYSPASCIANPLQDAGCMILPVTAKRC